MNKASNSRSKHSLHNESPPNLNPSHPSSHNPQSSQLHHQLTSLRKQLKQSQLKRNLALKQLSQSVSRISSLQQQLSKYKRQSCEKSEHRTAQKYKVQQLHLLNRQLTSEIDSLRSENQTLLVKLRHSTTVLQTKYQQLQSNTFSKITQAIKRIKKTTTYLTSLNGKELEKTRGSLVENLEKSVELLKGRRVDGEGIEEQVDELMSPLNVLKEELGSRDREFRVVREKLEKTQEQLVCEQKINRELLPQYKSGMEKLKKSLQLCRARIAELQTQKSDLKTSYQSKLKQLQRTNKQLNTTVTRLSLQNKVFQSKMQLLQGEVEEEKQRLMDQNQMLKKLYKSNQSSPEKLDGGYGREELQQLPLASSRSSVSMRSSSRAPGFKFGETEYQEKKFTRVNNRTQSQDARKSNISSPADLSQVTLRNQIDLISQQINQIQQTLKRQLQAYSY